MSHAGCKRRGARLWTRAGGSALLALAALGASGQARAQSIGYVLDNRPTALGTINPNPIYAFNSASADASSITISRKAAGAYAVTFAGLGNGNPSNVQVVAVTATSNYCTSNGWISSAKLKNVGAFVLCFNKTGTPADTGFALLYQARAGLRDGNDDLAYILANQPTSASYTPAAGSSFNSLAETITVARSGQGSYQVTMPFAGGFTGGLPLVTAVNKAATRCSLVSWFPIAVACVDHAGHPVDSEYSVLLADGLPVAAGPSTPNGAYGFACEATATSFYSLLTGCTKGSYSTLSFAAIEGRNAATGTYVLFIPGDPAYASSLALVTSQGEPGSYCNVAGWAVATSLITVKCYSAAGAPTNAAFTLAFQASSAP
jgi:hypothetical protein